MKSCDRDFSSRFWVGCLVVVLAAIGGYAQDKLTELRLPLGYYPDGTLKAELRASDADIESEIRFRGRHVRYRSYAPDGSVDIAMDAADALVNRATMTASSTGAVKIVKGEVEISGVGFDWYGEEKKVKIKSQARIEFLRNGVGSLTPNLKRLQTKQGTQQ
jgi:hypothetical protein